MGAVSGTCDARFAPVRDALEEQLASGNELGASIVIDVEGETVMDVWGGWRDQPGGAPWAEDTITNVWSSTKPVTNLAALIAVDRGLLDPYEPVAQVLAGVRCERQGGHRGPARAQPHLGRRRLGRAGHGRGYVRPRGRDEPAGRAGAVVGAGHRVGLPRAEPGSPGRRAGAACTTGKTLTAFVAEEIAGPLGADFQIGAAESDWDRIAPVVPPPPLPIDMDSLDPNSPMFRMFIGPPADAANANTPAWRRAEIGAMNGHGNARSVARIVRVLALGGGGGLLSPETIDVIFDEQSHGVDLVLGVPLRFGIGWGLPERETPALHPARAASASGAAGAARSSSATSTAA